MVVDIALVQVDLEREQERVQELVLFVETPGGVLEDDESQVLDNVGDTFGRDGRLRRVLQRVIEKPQELTERRLNQIVPVI